MALRLGLFLMPLAAWPAAAADWKPIDPAQLALKQPKIDPAADAEALLWEVRVSDEVDSGGLPTTIYQHYLRAKIFTDRGRERFATIDIPFYSGVDVRQVAARTVRPDGSIVEVKSSDIYQRTIVKANDLKMRVTSFAMPALERGAIVEYTWREYHHDSLATNLRLQFSRDIPVHEVRYYLRPLQVPGYGMVAFPFNGAFGEPLKQKDGFTVMSLTNVPAYVDEEYGLPELEGRPWMFVGYEPAGRSESPEDFARTFSKGLQDEYSKRSKPNDAMRKLAAAAIAGATTDAAKIAALTRVAREKVRRADVDTADPADRAKLKETKNAADALNRGVGTADDVLLVFLALADAAGLDAHVAALASRAELLPRSLRPHPAFTPERIAAVRSGSSWLFADPANRYSANGELPWQLELTRALIADPRDATMSDTEPSAVTYSVKRRVGTFRLLEDGTLEGEARLEYIGHWSELLKEQDDQDTAATREKNLRELMARRLPGAELSDVRIDNVTDPAKPYTNTYKIRIAGYAQRAGSRLIVQPAVFQKGVAQVLAAAERKTGLHFPFAWSEEDLVTIDFPAGFMPAEATDEAGFDVGAATYEPKLTLEASRLTFKRSMAVATRGLLYDQNYYRPFHAFFEKVHRVDGQAVVLRQKDAQ